MTIIEKVTPQDKARLSALLSEAKLPTVDLPDNLEHFIMAIADGTLVGSAGLEIYGQYALLRSVAVAANQRSSGIGAKLYEAILENARTEGIREVFLITDTAEQYFSKKGFERTPRETAPDVIQQTQQFSSICAKSAIVMKKKIEQGGTAGGSKI